jgi:tetratricopeptide (TPR) repeat protein
LAARADLSDAVTPNSGERIATVLRLPPGKAKEAAFLLGMMVVSHAGVLDSQGRSSEALFLHDEALLAIERCVLPGSPLYRRPVAMCLSDCAEALYKLGRFEHARRACNLALAILEQVSDPVVKANCWNTRACALHQLGRHTESVADCNKALEALEPGREPLLYARVIENRGNAKREMGRYQEAGEDYGRAFELYCQLRERHDGSRCYMHTALVLKELGHFDKALECFDWALSWCEDEHLKAVCHFNKAILLARMTRHEEAIADYDQARRLFRLLGRLDSSARCQLGKARELLVLGRSAEALTCLQELDVKLFQGDSLVEYHSGVGSALYCLGRYEEALVALNKARQAFPEVRRLGGQLALRWTRWTRN